MLHTHVRCTHTIDTPLGLSRPFSCQLLWSKLRRNAEKAQTSEQPCYRISLCRFAAFWKTSSRAGYRTDLSWFAVTRRKAAAAFGAVR
ncbi:hypothetical protein Y1Q_0016340 [Alligator mississippiensis]|uniref:Uncharacterized protein n=1 Tax=Alligator mississippiensis TaxID=8496 RepID=A0A151N2B4_ALLMI|nr:hypothetical protein Y1Q_0016340 [Alligator mississippiensis]